MSEGLGKELFPKVSVPEVLKTWSEAKVSQIPLGGLMSRNPSVYKWKAPFRSWMLRETVFWRLHDLLTQSYALHTSGHGLGARILLRSGYETLAVLIYLNHMIRRVLDDKLDFHEFSEKTCILLLGSRNGSTAHNSLNITTILEKCDRRYPGLASIYANLSESAHPNFEGLCFCYSKSDKENVETRFSNRWMQLFGDTHLSLMELCMLTFHHEYDDVWSRLMEQLEVWITDNNEIREAAET